MREVWWQPVAGENTVEPGWRRWCNFHNGGDNGAGAGWSSVCAAVKVQRENEVYIIAQT